jgi:hypothetical protein
MGTRHLYWILTAPSFAVKGDSGSTLNKKALAKFTHTVFELGARQLKKASKSSRSHLYRGERQPVFSLPQGNVKALQTWDTFSVMHAFLYCIIENTLINSSVAKCKQTV